MYPLQGSLLKWSHLRLGFALSLTQSTSDDNAGFSTPEILPIASTTPILNHIAIGLKNKTQFLPFEDGCHFAGLTNNSSSDGSSLGFMSSVICLGTKKGMTFSLPLTAPGVSGYNITSTPSTRPLSSPYNDGGSFYDLPVGQTINYNGKLVQLASAATNGATSLSLVASPSVNIANADINGTATTTQMNPYTSLGFINNSNSQLTDTTSASQLVSFPASSVMQGFTNYSTILIMDYVISNKGTISQGLKIGYQVITNQGDTSVENIQTLMASYAPTFESLMLNYVSQVPPTCIFVRWPFTTTRLRIHSIVAKRF